MRENGLTIKDLEKVMKYILMEIDMKDSLLMENLKEWVLFYGKMVKFMMVNGLRV